MKVGPSRNYLVRVLRAEWELEAWELEESAPDLYRDIYLVTLQTLVDLVFVPDVSAVAPPWTDDRLLAAGGHFATTEDARLRHAFYGSYVVTPNADRAGSVARVDTGHLVAVRYVAPAAFERFLADLDRLTDVVGSVVQATVRVDDLRDHEVIRFIDSEIVPAPWLLPRDAHMVGRDGGDRP